MLKTSRLHEMSVILGQGNAQHPRISSGITKGAMWLWSIAQNKTLLAHIAIKMIPNKCPPCRFLEKNAAGHFILVSDQKHIYNKICQAH